MGKWQVFEDVDVDHQPNRNAEKSEIPIIYTATFKPIIGQAYAAKLVTPSRTDIDTEEGVYELIEPKGFDKSLRAIKPSSKSAQSTDNKLTSQVKKGVHFSKTQESQEDPTLTVERATLILIKDAQQTDNGAYTGNGALYDIHHTLTEQALIESDEPPNTVPMARQFNPKISGQTLTPRSMYKLVLTPEQHRAIAGEPDERKIIMTNEYIRSSYLYSEHYPTNFGRKRKTFSDEELILSSPDINLRSSPEYKTAHQLSAYLSQEHGILLTPPEKSLFKIFSQNIENLENEINRLIREELFKENRAPSISDAVAKVAETENGRLFYEQCKVIVSVLCAWIPSYDSLSPEDLLKFEKEFSVCSSFIKSINDYLYFPATTNKEASVRQAQFDREVCKLTETPPTNEQLHSHKTSLIAAYNAFKEDLNKAYREQSCTITDKLVLPELDQNPSLANIVDKLIPYFERNVSITTLLPKVPRTKKMAFMGLVDKVMTYNTIIKGTRSKIQNTILEQSIFHLIHKAVDEVLQPTYSPIDLRNGNAAEKEIRHLL